MSVQNAFIIMRISDDPDKGEKRYAVYGFAENENLDHQLTFSGGTERRDFAEAMQAHPISYLFFHFVDRFWPPDLEEWLKSAFLPSDVREQLDNLVFDGETVEFTQRRREATVDFSDMVRLELGGARADEAEESFDPEVDASRRSVGGEEVKGSYRFDKNLTPAEIINLAKVTLAANAEEQGSGNRSTSMNEDGTPRNE